MSLFSGVLFFFGTNFYCINFFLLRVFMYLEAIESGRLPGDILDDIPCKYVDGTLVCEVCWN